MIFRPFGEARFMLLEPNVTPYDLRFSLFGVPVRVHPFFWVVAVFMGAHGDAQRVLIWVAVVFVSILIHEMGHALAARIWGSYSWVVLYGFGGLASHSPAIGDWRRRVAVMLAGPAAGFAFAVLAIVLILLTGNKVEVFLGGPFVFDVVPTLRQASPLAETAVMELLFVNIWWGLINLLPVYPLDGGQVSRELFLRFAGRDALRRSLWLSVIVAGGIALYGLFVLRAFFMLLLFGYLAYASYTALPENQRGYGDDGSR
jgi:stage IV sporulation protein FB